MSRTPAFRRLFRLVTARPPIEGDIDDELRFHLEMRAEELRRQGLPAETARAQAEREFGDVGRARGELATIDRRRHARAGRAEWWHSLWQDVRYGARGIGRRPGFAAVVLFTLALGIGATTAVATVVDATWFGWLAALRRPERLVMVFKTDPERGAVSPHDFRDWRAQARSFERVAAYMNQSATLGAACAGGECESERLAAVALSPDMFRTVGVRPLLGRDFLPAEEGWGSHRVVLLSHGLWTRRFGADPAVVGRTVVVDDEPHEVVGVMPRGAWFGAVPAELFRPLSFAPGDPRDARHSHFLWVVARLKDGVTLERANADLAALARRIAEVNPRNQGTSADASPLDEIFLQEMKSTLQLLVGAVALVLLVVCANVANLLLVRGSARERELGIRTALGATRLRLVRQLLTETLLLSLLGGALGVGLAVWGLRLVERALPIPVPRIHETGFALNGEVLAVALALTLLTGLVCGALPALQLPGARWSSRLGDMLKDGARGSGGGARGRRARSALVVGEVALALVLLTGAGLLVRSFARLRAVDTGVDPRGVLTLRISLPRAREIDGRARAAFYDRMVERVAALPGVRTAGVTSNLPLVGGGEDKPFWVEGRALPPSLDRVPSVSGRMESPRSLAALGVTLRRGRWLADADDARAPRVALVSEEIARRFFPGEDPIGKRISLHNPEALMVPADLPPGGSWPRWTVVGVVDDVRYEGPRDSLESLVYVPYRQGLEHWNWGPQFLVVKGDAGAAALAGAVRRAVREVDPSLSTTDLQMLGERMDAAFREPRFTLSLILVFAAVALVLGAVGLYGVVAYAVAQGTRAIGVRMALGAQTRDVLVMVLRRGGALALAGIAAGLVASAAFSRVLASQLYGVGALDPVTYGAVAALLGVVALLASYVPARRAARVDPVVALRGE